MAKKYAYADLSAKESLKLKIGSIVYDVTQYNATFAINDIPKAQCLLAMGRRAPEVETAAPIHTENKMQSMVPCEVLFTPTGEFHPDGTEWPAGETVIFRGYFVGFAYRKVLGKITITANLIHWMFDLASSSVTCGNAHPANPHQLNVPTVLSHLGAAEAVKVANTSEGWITARLDKDAIYRTDLWSGIRALFCTLAGIKTAPVHAIADPCFAGTSAEVMRENSRALRALRRFEAATEAGCPFKPDDGSESIRYSKPLALPPEPHLSDSAGVFIGMTLMAGTGNLTMWDKLLTEICPDFGLAVVPMVDRGLVIADLPSYSGGVWKELDHSEYDSFDMSGSLEQPLRGVSVIGGLIDVTGAFKQELIGPGRVFGGCFGEKSVTEDDGIVRYIGPPRWIRPVTGTMFLGGRSSGGATDPGKEGGSDTDGKAPNKQTPEQAPAFVNTTNKNLGAYAQLVYVNSMLRGRHGSLSGKLRFDIAPGSIIKIKQKGEQHLEKDDLKKDDLASTMVACVSHVTITINAEAGMAATSFNLTHIRREEDENRVARTSCDKHPFFQTAIHGGGKHGSPLIPKYDIKLGQAPNNSVLGNPGLGGGLNAAGLA